MKLPQFHLSTAIALMVTAGLLLAVSYFWCPNSNAGNYGWPQQAVYISDLVYANDGSDPFRNAPPKHSGVFTTDWNTSWAAFDAVVALLVLLWVGFIFEARHWGWPSGKIFVWAFVGAALNLVILVCLQLLIVGPIYPH